MFSLKIQKHAKSKMWKKWWLFHVTDFQSLMYFCFIFCRILGAFPYKINASTFEISKSRYILSTVITCVCCVLDLVLIYNITISKSFGDTDRILGLSYFTINGFVVITTYALSGPRMRLLQTISKISSKLSSESYQKLSRLIHVKDIFSIIFLFVHLCIYFSKTQTFTLTWLNFLFVLVCLYLDVLKFQMNMLYMNCVCVLNTCFKRINDDLTDMQKLMVNDTKLNVHRLMWQRNQFLLLELKTFQKQHLTVSETVHMLNIIFSLQLLATIVLASIEITFELYSYVVRWQDGVFITLDWQLLDVILSSMTFYSMRIMLLVWACETGKNQANEIGTTIHDVLNSTRDEQIKDELRLFSLQIMHCKNTFLTKSLTMDATLLTALVASIATYMLILIQFLIASHSCD